MASDAIFPTGLGTVEQLLLIAAGLIVAIMVAGPYVVRLRRRALEKPDQLDGHLKIDDVEELHQKGLISDEEFARLRNRSLGLEAAPRQEAAEGTGEKTDSG